MFERIREDFKLHGRRLRSRTFCAMLVYRFGHWSDGLRFGPFRWLLKKAYGLFHTFIPAFTGIQIDCRMKVGRRFHLIHAGPIQIHPDVTFGDHCGVMHSVTIGVDLENKVPQFGNHVFIGTGAVILGDITIGDHARIAANSLVITDVPADSLAMGVPARIYPHVGGLRSRARAESRDGSLGQHDRSAA